MPRRLLIVALTAVLALGAGGASGAATLDDVKARGVVACGVQAGQPGFSDVDARGEWRGFNADYCRAIATAIFADPTAVEFVPLSAKDRFAALQRGDVDVLARSTSWTMSRDTTLGLSFVGVNYYDGQAFMAKRGLGVASAFELNGTTICVQRGTTAEANLADYFAAHRMAYTPVVVSDPAAMVAAYQSGGCDVASDDATALYALRLTLAKPEDSVVLPNIVSKEPFGPVVRQGDDQWFDIVKWVHFALLDAEELGVTRANVDQLRLGDSQQIRRLLGTDGTFGADLGLTNAWAADAIRAVGNYAEIFDRNLGAGSPLKIARGLNALWTRGGIQYAPPVR